MKIFKWEAKLSAPFYFTDEQIQICGLQTLLHTQIGLSVTGALNRSGAVQPHKLRHYLDGTRINTTN